MLSRRAALALLAAAALAGGGAGAGCARKPGAARDPHARVACAGCHRGQPTPFGRSGVPDAACSSSGCHPGGGPDTARIAMVTFRHSRHPMSEQRTVAPGGDSGSAGGAKNAAVAMPRSAGAVPCAACHTHVPGSTVLQADSSTCALCHYQQIAGPRDAGCATCHPAPRHTSLSSQGVPLSHGMLREARVPCTRCHYRLVTGDTTVALARCASCHAQKPPAKLLPSDSAHAVHPELSCRSCHEPVTHRVVAMSGSIELQCLDCHSARHRPPIPADSSRTAKCSDCHAGVHAEQQRLLLGLMPGQPLEPSLMFVGGVTCRSCHVAPEAPRPRAGAELKPTAASCVGCHGAAWSGVLGRWERGYQRRRGWINAYLRRAEAALAGPGANRSALQRLAQAGGLMAYLQRAGAPHNLTAADRIMRDALALAVEAYRISGKSAPPVPELGPPVEPGGCLSCHYGIEEAPAGRDSASGRQATHADHLLRAYLPCDACHAAGAAPPGVPDSLWIRLDSSSLRPSPGARLPGGPRSP